MASFEAWQTTGDAVTPGLSPPRLRGRWGSALMRVFGAVKDAIADAAKAAVKARLVELAPDDALAWIGRERNVERYPGETNAGYRARLLAAWETWFAAGTAAGLVAALGAAGFSSVGVYDTRTAPPWWVGAWPPNGDDAMPAATWSRFWIVIETPHPWALRRWGEGGSWGELGADGTPLTWGSTATVREVALVRSIIRKWKAAHERCARVLVRVPDGLGGFVTLFWQGV